MSRWRNNGGWNKSHGTVEKTPRIDSFEAMNGERVLFAECGGKIFAIDYDRYTDYGPDTDRELVELWGGRWSQTVELSRKANGFGGSQAFFLCPACGERVRYLYLTGAVFLCRKCSRLNYRSQQETRSDSMYYYDKGMGLVEKHLEPPPFLIDGFGFCRWIPDRPRYMHQTTYRRYLRRFLRYQRRHKVRELDDLRRLLGPREWARVLQLQSQG